MKKALAGIMTAALLLLQAGCTASGVSQTPESAAPGVSLPETAPDRTIYKDIVYGSIEMDYQKLNISLPDGDGPFPVVVYIHGGGFRSAPNSAEAIPQRMAELVLESGYALVSINYRSADMYKFPAQISDCKAAIRFLRANAFTYRLNTDKIAVWGESAGGNLADVLGTSGNVDTLNGDNTENAGYSAAVQCVISWFAPDEFLKMDDQFKQSGLTPAEVIGTDTSIPANYFGQNITLDPARTESGAASHYIETMDAASAPSFFLEHGLLDDIVPYQQSAELAEALTQKLGVGKVKLQLFKSCGHNGDPFYTDENLKEVIAFIDDIFAL
jgi:acetyl esterase/lipase